MKRFLSLLMIVGLFVPQMMAQNDCTSPDEISSLPYSATGLTTEGTLDDYGPDDACLSVAMENEDYVFSFIPAADVTVNLSLMNTEIVSEAPVAAGATIGLFVLDGVPTDPLTNCVATVDDQTANPEIDMLSLTSGITYYIIVSSADDDYIIDTYSTTVNFDIQIHEIPDDDAGVLSVQTIESDCDMTDVEVTCSMKNYGMNEITSLDVAFSVDGGTELVETYTGSILYGATVEYTFTVLADVSGVGAHEIQVYTLLTGDETPTNDTATTQVMNLPVVATLPYTEDFEMGPYFWTFTEASSWEIGEPNDTLVINTAAEGVQILATNPDGNTLANESSTAMTPCFDFSLSNGVEVSFALWHELGLISASAAFEYTIDGGVTWVTIDDSWTGSSETWLNMEYELPELAGETSCRFRVTYEGDFLPVEGYAIDLFKIKELPAIELAVTEIIAPISSCTLTDSEIIKINLQNLGIADQTAFDLSYSTDGGNTWETEVYSDNLVAGDEVVFAFATPADFAAIGEYELTCAVSVAGDEFTENDTMTKMIYHGDIYSDFPYVESFEGGNAEWSAGGENFSMELAEPNAAIINAASDGIMAWVTNATGFHNAPEVSYLVSPCFDFSSLVNPIIDVDIFYNTQQITSEMVLQYSLDNGVNWDTVPAGGAAVNWYGSDTFSGTSWNGNSEQWITAHNNMEMLAGEPNVQLRFVFDAGDFSFGDFEGVAIDNIMISDCPDIPEAAFGYVMNTETEVAFTNESTNADSVEWNFGDNQFLPTTSNEENPVFTYPGDGSYTVTLTVFNECGSDQTTQTIDIITNSVNALDNTALSVYPNPVNDILYIQGEGLSNLKIYAIDGRLLMNKGDMQNGFMINTDQFESGLYIITVWQNGLRKSISFVKE
ncbi:MAG: PKD domain-containing protein [Bacteroidota bacterium]|nr:PKD domain-containing protein [Bacteroidota bacterium]